MSTHEEFLSLYEYIIASEDTRKMHILGNVVKSMMDTFIKTNPQMAKEVVDMLESVKWKNYVTQTERARIVGGMDPQPIWSFQQWEQIMTKFDLPFEKEHCYNKCALYVTMCMIDSDSCNTIISIMGGSEVSTRYSDEYFKNVYKLAIDKLTDKDGMFCIREYFKL